MANPGVFAACSGTKRASGSASRLSYQPRMILLFHRAAHPAEPAFPSRSPAALESVPAFPQPVRRSLHRTRIHRLRAELKRSPCVTRVLENWLSETTLSSACFPTGSVFRKADWPAPMRLTGFLLDGGPEQHLPPELVEFCQAGLPPPVFTSARAWRAFGRPCSGRHRGDRDPGRARHSSDEVSRSIARVVAACRGRHCAFASFQNFFPPLKATIVHHGGIGTGGQCPGCRCPPIDPSALLRSN